MSSSSSCCLGTPPLVRYREQPAKGPSLSFGCLFTCPASCVLADDDNDAVLFEKIKKGNYDADDPIWENISADAKDVVAKLLTVDSARRLSAEEALNHPWVQGKCFKDDKEGSQGEVHPQHQLGL